MGSDFVQYLPKNQLKWHVCCSVGEPMLLTNAHANAKICKHNKENR